jgi:hypothetical protein
LYSPKAGTLAPAGLFWASCKVKNIELYEAQNRPVGASVPALGLYNKAICSLFYRKPRTDQQELVFLL